MTAAARLSDDGSTVILSRGGWSGSFPVSQLASQLRFYRGLRDRGAKKPGEPGPHAEHYIPTVEALEALYRDLSK